MKKLFLTSLLTAGFVASSALAQTPIATWTFETSYSGITGTSATISGITPEVGSGSASGVHASSSTAWSSPIGNGSLKSFSANNWAVGDYFQFQVSTLGYSDISVSYDQTSSGTGPGRFDFAYSIDGSTFTTVTSNYTVLANSTPNSWSSSTPISAASYSFDLSPISALNDASTVYFRVINASTTSANGGTVASSGTGRIDNFSVVGTPIPVPEPSTYALLGLSGLALLFRRFSR